MKRFCVALALVLSVSGCVYTHTTDLAMPPPGVRVKQGGAGNIALKVSVSDMRPDRTNIGTLHSAVDSSYKYVVHTTQPVEAVVGKAIESEFAARGYRLADGPVFLLVDIQQAVSSATWQLMRTNVMGDVVLSAKVLNADGRVLYTKTYRKREDATNTVFIGNYDEGKVQLEKVLASVIREMAEDGNLVQALVEASPRR